ncbi:MAG: hypothetical protein SP1CHLAM54_16590 [Chlamydiia bacterium]|nr:hypothetical protein [Chlamydiia bacterium]MCH9616548.1 hypothetical protein [Chlamydiia bacterium]MCH9629278.1 hypothetical protein [Chlamydiia bacterium]
MVAYINFGNHLCAHEETLLVRTLHTGGCYAKLLTGDDQGVKNAMSHVLGYGHLVKLLPKSIKLYNSPQLSTLNSFVFSLSKTVLWGSQFFVVLAASTKGLLRNAINLSLIISSLRSLVNLVSNFPSESPFENRLALQHYIDIFRKTAVFVRSTISLVGRLAAVSPDPWLQLILGTISIMGQYSSISMQGRSWL